VRCVRRLIPDGFFLDTILRERLLTFSSSHSFQQRRNNMRLLMSAVSLFVQSDFFQHLNAKDVLGVLILAGLAVFGMIMVNNATRRREQNAMQKALLEKFASARDFAEFMQSPAGQKYVMSFTDTMTSPRQTILSTVRIGIVAIFLGAGFYSITRDDSSIRMFGQSAGAILTCVGFGFLLSAAVSYWLAKKLSSGEKE
jgi:hypothetical protein